MRLIRIAVAFCLLAPSLSAAQLPIAWDYPRTATPSPTRFVVEAQSPQGATTEYAVPIHPVTDCTQFASITPNTWCARIPCPAPGAYTWYVRAEFGDKRRRDPTPALCTVVSDAKTGCRCGTLHTEAQPPAPAPTPTQPIAPSIPTPQPTTPAAPVLPAPLPIPTPTTPPPTTPAPVAPTAAPQPTAPAVPIPTQSEPPARTPFIPVAAAPV